MHSKDLSEISTENLKWLLQCTTDHIRQLREDTDLEIEFRRDITAELEKRAVK